MNKHYRMPVTIFYASPAQVQALERAILEFADQQGLPVATGEAVELIAKDATTEELDIIEALSIDRSEGSDGAEPDRPGGATP